MKKTLNKGVILCVYLLVLLWIVDFRLFEIFDLKMMASVLIGSVILTLAVKDKSDLKRTFLYQVTLTSVVATTLLYLKAMSLYEENYILPLQPMFYGMLYYAVFSVYIDMFKKAETQTQEIEYHLTDREKAIAIEIVKGLSNKEIAARLFIAESTVKKHVQNIYKKTEVTNRQDFKQLYQ